MIKLEGVTKIYSTESVGLRNINLHIKAGEFVSIVGQSGTGKTTLVRLLIAEEKPTKGKIVIGDWDITKIPSGEIPYLRRQIGVIFQDFKLLPKKTVYENVSFALEVAGEKNKHIAQIVPQVLDVVGLGNKMHRYPRQLSGGEQQRVAIARSLVHRPKIIIADEPTGNLDRHTANIVFDLLLEGVRSRQTSLIMVTHDIQLANKANRVFMLDDGHLSD